MDENKTNYNNDKSKKIGKIIAVILHIFCVLALFVVVINNPSIISIAVFAFSILWFVLY